MRMLMTDSVTYTLDNFLASSIAHFSTWPPDYSPIEGSVSLWLPWNRQAVVDLMKLWRQTMSCSLNRSLVWRIFPAESKAAVIVSLAKSFSKPSRWCLHQNYKHLTRELKAVLGLRVKFRKNHGKNILGTNLHKMAAEVEMLVIVRYSKANVAKRC